MNTPQSLEALNTEWNRKAGILPGKGSCNLLGVKHGIAYFTWTDLDKSVLYLQCDEFVLKKHFRVSAVPDSTELLDALLAKKARFLKYPFEVSK